MPVFYAAALTPSTMPVRAQTLFHCSSLEPITVDASPPTCKEEMKAISIGHRVGSREAGPRERFDGAL